MHVKHVTFVLNIFFFVSFLKLKGCFGLQLGGYFIFNNKISAQKHIALKIYPKMGENNNSDEEIIWAIAMA